MLEGYSASPKRRLRMKVEVHQKIEVYEVDGIDVPIGQSKKLEVNSHWNRAEFVVMKFGKTSFTVSATNLSNAIRNATNTGM